MKLISTILLMFCGKAHATNYYVSNSGSNAANGLTQGTAWQTIGKVNSSSFSAGDSILFKCGDTWNEKLIIPSSGSVGNSIVFTSYGTGVKPLITGFQTATGFTDSSGIQYTTLTNSVKLQNNITVDGIHYAKARTPNTGYYSSYPNTYTQLTNNANVLPYNFTGAEVIVMTQAWIWDHVKISSQTGTAINSNINLQSPLTYNTTAMYFAIQNDVRCIDLTYEWAVDSATKKFWIKMSSGHTVQYSSIDTVILVHGVNYVTFSNLSITGGNMVNIATDTCRNITIKNCTINNAGYTGITLNKSHQMLVDRDSITNSWNDGIYTRFPSDTCSFINTVFKNSGTAPGMNMNGNSAMCHTFHYGLKATFSNNILDSSGYHGFYWFGQNADIENNYITYFCLTTSDGGGIYTYPGLPSTGSLIKNNICGYGIGYSPSGTVIFGCGGVYLDGQSDGITVQGNTIFNCSVAGLIINGGTNISAINNNVVSNGGYCLYIDNASAFANSRISNNIYYSTIRSYAVNFEGNYNSTTVIDSSFILRSVAPDSLIRDGNIHYYNLAGWQSFSGKDIHSTATFPSAVTTQTGILFYNPTSNDSSIILNGNYIDVSGVLYFNSFILNPYQSKLLFPILYNQKRRVGSLNFQ